MHQQRARRWWLAGWAMLSLCAAGCARSPAPTSGKLVVLWAAEGTDGRAFDLKLYNKGQGLLHVERIAVLQGGRPLAMTSSHQGPHSLEAGAECTVHITLPTGLDAQPRQLVLESDGTPSRELTLPLDLRPEA